MRAGKASMSSFLVFLSVVFALLIVQRSGVFAPKSNHTPEPLPELMAAGWLNIPGADSLEINNPEANTPADGESDPDQIPTRESLLGKVVLLDAWFVDCPHCVAAMPKLAQLKQKYADTDLVVIGITPDDGNTLPRVEGLISRVQGFDWPVGYGATPTLDMLSVRSYPTFIVFGRDGQSIYRGHSMHELENLLDDELL